MTDIAHIECGTLNNTHALQREQKGGVYDGERQR
jgi:hypothetical protein